MTTVPRNSRRPRSSLAAAAGVAVAMVLALLTACSDKPSWRGSSPSPSPTSHITVTSPADQATDVPTSAEIAYTATGASGGTVEVIDPAGATVAGSPRADGSSWMPDRQLKYATRYTVKITVTVKGKPETATTSFTTMAKPANLVRLSSAIGDDQVVGVGMPVVLTLSGGDVAKDERAAVQRRLFMASDPPQEGAWNWFNGHELHFRPREYWKPGTKLSLRAAFGGLPLGNGRYGSNDITVRASVGQQLIMKVDNAAKQMTVTQDGTLLKTLPVSLGKPSSPSSSGNLVVMVKMKEELFDSSTYGVPADSKDGYRTLVRFTQRLTWDGQYIHAAPWSVADQGRRNVSHGCVNVSDADAEWLFGLTHLGDPVIVSGTEEHVQWGNGWTDWDVDFDEYVKRGGAATASSPSSSSFSSSPR